jgi:hypothetical protein
LPCCPAPHVPGKTAAGRQPLPKFADSIILYVFVAERQPQIVAPAASLGPGRNPA